MKIKVDNLRGIRPGYTVGVPTPWGTKVFGPYNDIRSMTPETIKFLVGGETVTLPREQEIDAFGVINALSTEEAVQLWEDHVGDSGKSPTDEEIRDFANAVLRSVGIR